ncbi:hypothetical protein [Streptomyces sp. NPDC059970]|uniref:hypothetical protein n=1 Tax=Streptomyces sp. NPDC059970 TaxID=3347019 RepID=UPI0036A23098
MGNSNFALDLLQAIRPSFHPSVIDASIDCRYRQAPEIRLGELPIDPVIRISRNGPPAYERDLIPHRDSYVTSTVGDMNDDALRRWLTAALQQSPPDEDSLLTLGMLNCHYGSAWFGHAASEASVQGWLKDDPADSGVKVELFEHEDELWVSAPGVGYAGNAPLSVDVVLDDERLVATVRTAWTPWADPSSPQHARLQSGLEQLTRYGWKEGI